MTGAKNLVYKSVFFITNALNTIKEMVEKLVSPNLQQRNANALYIRFAYTLYLHLH